MKKNDKTLLLFALLIFLLGSCQKQENKNVDYIQIPNSYDDLSDYYQNQSDSSLFTIVPSAESGISFYNQVHETLENSFWLFKFLFSGSGVGAGDFNNDGLIDLFFVSNNNANALYLNKGNLQFEDISVSAGIIDTTGFSMGVSIADFNQDGWLDIYISKAGGPQKTDEERANKLFINNQDLTFTESAKAFGLDHSSNSTQASLLDYDHDGDLDLYLTSHWLKDRQLGSLKSLAHIEKGVNFSDQFFRNNGDNTFTNISKEVGVNNNGVGWSGTVGDFNNDLWPDIYVANDFIMYNYLYLNTQQGHFKQAAFESLKKMTRFGMGSDIGDVNNDGWQDVIVAGIDMEDHINQKSMLDFSDTKSDDARLASGFHYQKERNTLQLNNGDGTFSEIGCFSGTSTTNWTWGIHLEDFDNDGWADVFAANGYYNPWFMDNRFNMYGKVRRALKAGKKGLYFKLRNSMFRNHHKHPNQIYQNNKDLTFASKTEEWGLEIPTVSYGALVADLDNDGDMDIVASNTNHQPIIYKNRASQLSNNHYLKFTFLGPTQNRFGWGAKVQLHDAQGNLIQAKEQQPVRGYLSTSDHRVNFGLGSLKTIPNVMIIWPDGKTQNLQNVSTNQIIKIDYKDAIPGTFEFPTTNLALFEPAPEGFLDYQHIENPYDDFDRQFTLHAKQSRHGPAIAVADVNGDYLDDVFLGGAKNAAAALYLQQADGSFRVSKQPDIVADKGYEDMGSLFFDADQDGDLDLYQISGGGAYHADFSVYQDRLYLNDGQGNFKKTNGVLPEIQSSGSCVVAADYDQDGDQDLFVAGRVVPSFYPQIPRSYLLENQGGTFVDVTPNELKTPGLISSALWTDFNNDDTIDLIIAGEWMPVRFFQNQNGSFTEVTEQTGLSNMEGWWKSIAGADLDEDGDIDYILGNEGLNTYYKTSPESPFGLVYGDFNTDEQLDLIYTYEQKGNRYPVFGFGAFQKSFPEWKEEVDGFTAFAKMTFPEIQNKFFPGQGKELSVKTFANIWLENKGNGQFEKRQLPAKAQLAPINGLITGDFNNDGHADILCHGNFYPAHYAFERQDAGTGLLLTGDGSGNFEVYRGKESGFFSDSDARSLVLINRGPLPPVVLAANNSDHSRAFILSTIPKTINFLADDLYALVQKAEGKVQKVEHYRGSGYLSQTSAHFLIGAKTNHIEIIEKGGIKRIATPLTQK